MFRIGLIIATTTCIGFADLLRAQEPILLRPFEVSTDKNVGDSRFNTRSGGRVDTPLASGPQAKTAGVVVASTSELPSLRIAVSEISESRNSQGSSTTNLTLSIVGEGLSQDALVRQVNITKAIDSNDQPLAGGRGAVSQSPLSMINRPPGGMAQPMRATVPLGVVPRGTDSIKYVEGTIEVFVPAESNGSIIRIGNIKSHLGRVEDPTLAKYGIVFHFLGDQASEDEARALRAQRGGGGSVSSVQIDSIHGYGLFFRDPSGKLAGVQLQDGKGVPFQPGRGGGGGGSNSGSLVAISLQSPIMDDSQLVIYVAVPESIKTVPFRVEDIPLP